MDDELDEIRNPVGIDVGAWLPEPGDVSSGLAGTLFDVIINLCVEISRAAPDWPRLRDELERLVLWGGSFSLDDGRLDEVLSRSSELRLAILSALCELGRVVKDDLLPALTRQNKEEPSSLMTEMARELQQLCQKAATVLDPEERIDPDLSDSESSSSHEDMDVNEILDDVTIYIDCLMDLAPVINSPVLDPERDGSSHPDVETFSVSSSQAAVFCHKIRDRFPKMPKFLVERLGEANASRADRLKAMRDQATARKEPSMESQRKAPDFLRPLRHSESAPKVAASSGYFTRESESVFDEPYTMAIRSKAKFRDDDDASLTTFASFSTAFSTLEKGRPRVPPLPSEGADGNPFTFLVCHKTLSRVFTRAAWKYGPFSRSHAQRSDIYRKHVFEDLQPYVCTIQGCTKNKTRFSSSMEWANHEATHPTSRASTCAICVSETRKDLSKPTECLKHVAEHMREISLAVLPQNLEPNEDDSDDELDDFVSAPEVIPKAHWVVPHERNSAFVGREMILDHVLEAAQQILSVQNPRVVSLLGLGGTGKSEIALEAVYRLREQDSTCSVFWVSATSFKADYRVIGQDLQVEGINGQENTVHLVNSALSKRGSERWIMVIDNANDEEVFSGHESSTVSLDAKLNLPSEGNGVVLVTTRSRAVATHVGGITIDVDVFTREDGIELLQTHLAESQLGGAESVDKLLDLLEDHPLALKQALAYMERTKCTTTEYLQQLESHKYPILAEPECTIEYLAGEMPDALEYLKMLAFVGEGRIPKEILPPGMENTEEEATSVLERLGFAHYRQDHSVHVHILVQRAINSWLESNGELDGHVTGLIQRIAHAYPSDKHRSAWSEYLPHAQSVLRWKEHCTDEKATSDLLFQVGRSLYLSGDFQGAEDHLSQSLNLSDDFLTSSHPEVLAIRNCLWSICLQLGYYTAAEELQNKAEELIDFTPNNTDPHFLQTVNNVALALDHQGNYAESEEMHRIAMHGYEKSLGKNHLETLRSKNNLASVLKSQNRYDEALQLHEEAQAGFEKILGPDHADTLMSLNNLAVLHACQGHHEQAERIFQNVFVRLDRTLGPHHPHTLITMKNLADMLLERDDLEAAEKYYRVAAEGLEDVFGSRHAWTRSCWDGLALCTRELP